MSYAKKTLFGTIWNVSLNVYNQAASFIVYALLARILLVEDFGLIAFCFLLTEMAVLFGNFGVNQILIQRPRWSHKLASNCFWLLLTFGSLLGFTLAFIAGPISNKFFYSGSWSMLALLGLIPVISSLSLVSYARMMRYFQYRQIAVFNMLSTTIGAFISIFGVIEGFGVWAVIWGRVVQCLTLTLCLIIADRFVPTITFSKNIFQVILKFGLPLFYQTAVSFLSDRSVAIVVAALLGATQFAYIALAQRAFRMIKETTITPLNGILLPAFSRLKDKATIAQQFARIVTISSTFVMPLFLGAAAVSKEIVVIAFGEKWQTSSSLFSLLCFTMILNSLIWYIPQAMVSIKRTDISFKMSLITAIFNVTLCAFGAFYSTKGAVIGLLISSILLFPVKFAIARRYIPIDIKKVISGAMPAIVCSMLMYTVLYCLSFAVSFSNLYLAFIIKITLGMMLYLILFTLLFKNPMNYVFTEIKFLLKRS